MSRRDGERTDLDGLIEEITVNAYGADEKLWAFWQALEDNVAMPMDGFVVGEPLSVIEFLYDGNARRGLTARCRRRDGSEHVVGASDVEFLQGTTGARFLAAYRKWLGVATATPSSFVGHKRQHKATAEDLDLSGPIELVVLAVKENAARCRLLGSERTVTFRATRLWDAFPGVIVVVKPRKQWSYAGHPYLSGEIEATRLDVGALGLVPLSLNECGVWDPREQYWGEEGEPVEEWSKPIIARGRRPEFKMERLFPGANTDDSINKSNDLIDAGDRMEAHRILMKLCQADLRCLDAHAHLGNFVFKGTPGEAIRHYEAGLRIGELSLCEGFGGLLPWYFVDNRPFLRCMHGYGLCLWRLERLDESRRVFERMLWLNPADNQGARFLVDDVQKNRSWEERRDAEFESNPHPDSSRTSLTGAASDDLACD